MKEVGDKAEKADVEAAQAAVEQVKEALKGEDAAAMNTATEALTEAMYKISAAVYAKAGAQAQADTAGAAPDGGEAGEAKKESTVDADFKVNDNS